MSTLRRIEHFKNYLKVISTPVEAVVQQEELDQIKQHCANKPIFPMDVATALKKLRKYQLYDYTRQITDKLNDQESVLIPPDLQNKMIAAFAAISSEDLHNKACADPHKRCLPPTNFVMKKLAIEFDASPEIIALFPESKETWESYWSRLRAKNAQNI